MLVFFFFKNSNYSIIEATYSAFLDNYKVQLISKCLFVVIVWTKIATKFAGGRSKNKATKSFRAEILTIFSLLFWSNFLFKNPNY
jgi:hypothetical protein